MSTSDWYDDYRKKEEKGAAGVTHKEEISQNILFMKAVGTKAFDNKTDRTTFTAPDGTFGFTEPLVNQLMEFAYDQGRKVGDEISREKGWNDCWQDVMNKLGVEESDY